MNPLILAFSAVVSAPLDLPALERRLLDLSNAERAKKGLQVLAWDDQAAAAARGHSQEMARLGYAGHDSPTKGREKPGDRIWLAGITSTTHGENVGLHSVSGLSMEELAQRMMRGWMESPHHRDNILSPKFSHLGLGAALGKYQGMESVFLTQTFLGRLVLDAKLIPTGSRGSFKVTGKSLVNMPLVVYWKENGEVKFEDVAGGPGAFEKTFQIPAGKGDLELLIGTKKETRTLERTNFHFDFTDRFFVDRDSGAVRP